MHLFGVKSAGLRPFQATISTIFLYIPDGCWGPSPICPVIHRAGEQAIRPGHMPHDQSFKSLFGAIGTHLAFPIAITVNYRYATLINFFIALQTNVVTSQ
jgi:hypothetical protein